MITVIGYLAWETVNAKHHRKKPEKLFEVSGVLNHDLYGIGITRPYSHDPYIKTSGEVYALASLALMITTSAPEQKDIIKLVMNILVEGE